MDIYDYALCTIFTVLAITIVGGMGLSIYEFVEYYIISERFPNAGGYCDLQAEDNETVKISNIKNIHNDPYRVDIYCSYSSIQDGLYNEREIEQTVLVSKLEQIKREKI